MDNAPLVSICCETYNHAKYIRQALDGFLSQKTDFSFEILIHDDASTDGTQSIIEEYYTRNPDLFKPIFQTENQHSKGISIWRKYQFPRAKGKYIALCEGDDYWTDPLKLQKQVDFLESHPDYSMCFHNAILHTETGNEKDRLFADLSSREYEMKENIDRWIIATASTVFRRSVLVSAFYKECQKSSKLIVGDLPLFMSCFKCGRVYGFSDAMSVYRLHSDGWTQKAYKPTKIAIKLIEQELELKRIFGGYFDEIYKINIAKHSRAASSLLIKGKFRNAFDIFRMACKYAPVESICANLRFIFSMIRGEFRV